MIKYKILAVYCRWEPFTDVSTSLVEEGKEGSVLAAARRLDKRVPELVNELPKEIKESISCLETGIEYQLLMSTNSVPEWRDIKSTWAFEVLEGSSRR